MSYKNIHFVGIKGVGMAALAVYCQERGFKVTGSDIKENFITDVLLQKFHIPVYPKFDKKNINPDIDLMIYSGAYDIRKNPETKYALVKKIPLLSHGEALGWFMNEKKGISVAGTHGKTTSTALLTTVFVKANLDPSYIIGTSEIKGLKTPGHFGQGNYFIVEADEYQTSLNFQKKPRFLWQNPFCVLLTNIDFDHPDVFKDLNEVKEAFRQLIVKIPKNGFLFYNGDDEDIRDIIKDLKCRLVSFGENPKNNFVIKKVHFQNQKTIVEIENQNYVFDFSLNLIGKHNAFNACGVYAVAKHLGLKESLIRQAFDYYQGCKRRLEKKKEKNGILYYDDYAHHPVEIKNTLEALKSQYPSQRLIVIFQPHTFSRTQALLSDFKQCFQKAEVVIITKIFASVREKQKNFKITSRSLFTAVKQNKSNVFYADSFSQVLGYLKNITKKNDVVVTMGAGDIYKIHEKIN